MQEAVKRHVSRERQSARQSVSSLLLFLIVVTGYSTCILCSDLISIQVYKLIIRTLTHLSKCDLAGLLV